MAVSKPLMQECSICLDGFETPKVLSCGHTFCLHCIDPIISRAGLKPTLVCPVCRSDVDLPGSGRGEDLPTNFQLLSMLDDIQKEGKVTEEVTGEGGKCSTHGEGNKFYCRTCKTMICPTCMLTVHKIGQHDIIAREDFVKRQEEIINKVKGRLSDVEAIYSRVDSQIGEKKRMLSQDKHAIQIQITTALEKAYRKLGQHAESLYKEVLDVAGMAENNYEEFRQKLACHVESMQELSTATEYLREGQDADELNQEIEDLIRDLGELETCTGSLATSLCLSFMPTNMEYQVGSLARGGGTIEQGADKQPKPSLRRRLLQQWQGTSSARVPPRPRKPKQPVQPGVLPSWLEEDPYADSSSAKPDQPEGLEEDPYAPLPSLKPEQPEWLEEDPYADLPPPELEQPGGSPSWLEEDPYANLPPPEPKQPEIPGASPSGLEEDPYAILPTANLSPPMTQPELALSSKTSAKPRQQIRQQPRVSAPSSLPGGTELLPKPSPPPIPPKLGRQLQPLSGPGEDSHGSAPSLPGGTEISLKRLPPPVRPKPRHPLRPLSAPGEDSHASRDVTLQLRQDQVLQQLGQVLRRSSQS